MYKPTLEDLTSADRDAQIMTELADRSVCRATLCPITLATIGLPWAEVQAIARELASGIEVHEGPVEDIELCAHGVSLAMIEEHWTACSECAQQRAEDSEVSTEWFAGGFADNH